MDNFEHYEPPDLYTCIMYTARNKEFVKEYDRLRGSNLSLNGSPIDLLIDECSGRQESELREFIEFVYEWIYLPLQQKNT